MNAAGIHGVIWSILRMKYVIYPVARGPRTDFYSFHPKAA